MDKDALTELIRPHALAIEIAAAAGNVAAKRVINLYELHREWPDDVTAQELGRVAFDEWVAKQG